MTVMLILFAALCAFGGVAMLGGKLADYPSPIGPIGRALFYLGFWPFLGLAWLMAALSFVGLFLVVQILRLVPVDSAGQTAGIDPKRTVVATDSMSRIDVERT